MENVLTNQQYQIARYNFLVKQEGYIPELYFDNRGFLTAGTGYLIARGYVSSTEKTNSPIIQSSMFDVISNAVGGLSDAQQRVVDITASTISEIQINNPTV